MAFRCRPDELQSFLRDYDTSVDLIPFIEAANVLTNRVSAKDTDGVLGTDELHQIEKSLAGHFYRTRDPDTAEETTEKAGGIFTDQFGLGLESTREGKNALLFDETGYLRRISTGVKKAQLLWGGKPPSTQVDYVDRD